MTEELKSYTSLLEADPLVAKIVTPEMVDAVFATNVNTVSNLKKRWSGNLRKNIKLYKKHTSLMDFYGFGTNKAVIGVGAGPSFNRNKDYLKKVYEFNTQFPLDDQPFIIVATNKQFKPLLEMGIHPHFVVLVDAGDALYDQLCTGIPKIAHNSFLITGLHTSPKILERWDKRGGQLLFYLIGEDDDRKFFEKETGQDSEPVHIQQGGNVINTLWILSIRFFGSTVYITVGNDLSFKLEKDKEKRKAGFYADGDYSVNIANKRDEAKDYIKWMGFELNESAIVPDHITMNMMEVGTSKQMCVYKMWMEVQAAIWLRKMHLQFYNASEAGMLGVLAKSFEHDALYSRDNWYLMDELEDMKKHWHTRTLKQAVSHFLEAKRCLKEIQHFANTPSVITSPERGGVIAPVTSRNGYLQSGSGIIL